MDQVHFVGISSKKVEDLLSRSLAVIDPSDVCKENARKMQYLYKVRNGSLSKENGYPLLVNGYTGTIGVKRK